MQFPQYESYKDSGIEWLGNIPSHWNVQRAKFLFAEVDERSETGKEELLSVSHLTGVTPRSEKNVNMFMAEDYTGYKICREGDLVINIMWAWMGALGVSNRKGIVSSSYSVFRQKSNEIFDSYFLEHLLRTPEYVAQYNRLSKGLHSSRLRLYSDVFLNLFIKFPPKKEQERIVDFLNHKTAEIDKAIAKKQKLIKLLQEQKAILINRAVTKGLNPNVPMRDSGIEWVGEIPEYWEVKRVKDVFDNLNNRRIPLSAESRGKMEMRLYDYYGASGIIDRVDQYIFDEDLIIIAEDGANLVMRNLRLALIATGKYWVNNHAHILRPKSGDIYFLCEALECLNYNPFISGAAQPKLTKDALHNVYFPVPPKSEQVKIASVVKKIKSEFKTKIAIIDKEINLFKELKSVLISNAVTGKIKI